MIEKKSISQIAIDTLSQVAVFAYLMGSAETPRFRDDSDVDIAYYPKDSIPAERIKSIHEFLEETFERSVDLVSLKNIDLIYGRQVLESGRLLFVHDKEQLLRWKVYHMSLYPDFKRSIEVITKNLLNKRSL